MKVFVFLLSLLVGFSSCKKEADLKNPGCDPSIVATVRDLTGLDGCGFVFELKDGTRLEPSGTPHNFIFTDGKKVRIVYEQKNDAMSICMVGKIVKIICIEEIETTQ